MSTRQIGRIVFSGLVLGVFLVTTSVMGLNSKEKLDLLEARFLKGEVSEKVYLELREKCHGGDVATVAQLVKAEVRNLMQNSDFELDEDKNQIPDGWF